MNSRFFALVALLVVATAVAPIGTVAAQNATTTAANTTTTSTGASSEAVNVSIELSQATKISSWQVKNGQFHITIKSKIPTVVKISDTAYVMQALSEGDGRKSVEIPTRGYTIGSGTTTLKFDATMVDGGTAATVATPDGAALLRTDDLSAGDKPAISWQTVQLLIVGTIGTVAGGTIRVVRKKAEDEDKEAERVL